VLRKRRLLGKNNGCVFWRVVDLGMGEKNYKDWFHRFFMERKTGVLVCCFVWFALLGFVSGLTYETGMEVYSNFSTTYNSEGVYVNGSETVIGNVNRSIDEVLVFNRVLGGDEVLGLYNASLTYHNFTSLESGSYFFRAFVVDVYGLLNSTLTRVFSVLGVADLSLWDSSNDKKVYTNYSKFVADYTMGGSPLNGSGEGCSFRYNVSGSWSLSEEMVFNGTSGGYEMRADGGYLVGHRGGMPSGEYWWNVSCWNDEGYDNLSSVDFVNISEYPTSLGLENSTDTPSAGVEMMFYANYSSDFGGVSGVGLNGSEIGRVVWGTGDIDSEDGLASLAFVDCEMSGEMSCVAVSGDGFVSVYYGNGSLKYSDTTPADIAYKMIVGDLNGDGYYNEFVRGDAYQGDNFLVYNESGFVFEPSENLGYAFDVVIGDFDGDGRRDDIAVSSSDDYIYVYNTSDGVSWSQMWNLSAVMNINSLHELTVLDVNGDGIDDIGFTSAADDNTSVIYGNNGSFVWSINPGSGAHSIVGADLDNDGNLDEVYAGEYGDPSAYNETGGVIWAGSSSNSFVQEVAIIDLNGDGQDGVVFGSVNQIDVYNRTGELICSYGSMDSRISSISVADFDNDGFEDILVGTGDEGGSLYLFNSSCGLIFEFNASLGDIGKLVASNLIPGSSPATDFGDLNSDGVYDMGAVYEDGYLVVYQEVSCIARFSDGGVYDMVWNRSLNKWEINKTFGSTGAYDYNVTCSKGGYDDGFSSSNINVGNTVPDTPNPSLVSVGGTNVTGSDLNCSGVVSDADGDDLNVTVRWYKDFVLNLTMDYNNSYSNGTMFSSVLGSGNTSRGEFWNCSMRFSDGYS
jgi:hypothetical protein